MQSKLCKTGGGIWFARTPGGLAVGLKNDVMLKKMMMLVWLVAGCNFGWAQSKHAAISQYPEYAGRVMCGYQGWFRAPGDGANEGWGHYLAHGKFDADHLHTDFWPDVSEYPTTYPTVLTNQDGSIARVFSSADQSTTDLHFKWMQDYGVDGVFVQRFFGGLRTAEKRKRSRLVLEHAVKSSQQYGRAIAVMYDLSGLGSHNEDCSALIQDWKELVDDLKITSQPTNNYLYYHGKPVVAIWGLGFPDRPYDIHQIGLEKLIDFLKNDPQYGGCAIMLGVPTHFRELNNDCLPDPYLHEVMAKVDIILPWMVGRFSPREANWSKQYEVDVQADLRWCQQRHLAYVPCVYPGFSWHNLSNVETHGPAKLNQIPRLQGTFYWDQIIACVQAGSKMLYVAMFDEMDEGTAIFKCANKLPVGPELCDYEGLPTDHYLWLTGEAGKLLRGTIPVSRKFPAKLSLGHE